MWYLMSTHFLAPNHISPQFLSHSYTHPLHHPHKATKISLQRWLILKVPMLFPLPGMPFSVLCLANSCLSFKIQLKPPTFLKNLQLMPLLAKSSGIPLLHSFSIVCIAVRQHLPCWTAIASDPVYLLCWPISKFVEGSCSALLILVVWSIWHIVTPQ